MKSKIRTKELQENYKSMTESVELFVVKEGKTLQQAFHSAEQELIKAKELSQEKVLQASRYLKNNLRLLVEATDGVSDAYKDQLKFDFAYVNDSLWRSLQSIVNSNANDLLVFTRTLKDKAKNALTEEHILAHQEHNQWDSDHALWIDEIEFWKNDHCQVLAKLGDLEQAFKRQTRSLFEHTQVIKAHIETHNKHEQTIANAEIDPSSQNFKVADEQAIAVHQQERRTHAKQSEVHHALKTNHYKTMAMFNMLYNQINKI